MTSTLQVPPGRTHPRRIVRSTDKFFVPFNFPIAKTTINRRLLQRTPRKFFHASHDRFEPFGIDSTRDEPSKEGISKRNKENPFYFLSLSLSSYTRDNLPERTISVMCPRTSRRMVGRESNNPWMRLKNERSSRGADSRKLSGPFPEPILPRLKIYPRKRVSSSILACCFRPRGGGGGGFNDADRSLGRCLLSPSLER